MEVWQSDEGNRNYTFRTGILALFILLLTLGDVAFAVTRTSALSGNWYNASTWLPAGVPSAEDDVVITTGNTITVCSDQSVRNLTVNSGGTLKWSTTNKLSVSGSLTVYGKVDMHGGDLALTTPGSAFTLGENSIFTWRPADNTVAGASLFKNGIENFSSTSTLVIQEWYDYSVPLCSDITGNFGNLELNSLASGRIYEWNQNNGFETHKIPGTLTIDQGWITLDKSGTISNTTVGNIILKNLNSSLYGLNGTHPGSFTITTSSVMNNGGIFYGLNDGDGNITIHVTGDFNNLGNVKIITNSGMTNLSNGNASFIVDGTFTQSMGDTRVLYNVNSTNSGLFTASFNKLILTGGIFMAQTACRTSGGICSFSVLNDFTINFSSRTDKFRTTSLSSVNSNMNNVEVQFNVGGNLTIGGNATSEFTSAASAGKETATIHGDLIITGADASFNYGTVQASHDNVLNVDGNISVTNGSLFLSRNNGTASITANGNLSVNSGALSVKGGTGTTVLNLMKNFSLAGGIFYLHNNNSNPATSSVTLNAKGDFSQSSGIFSFDNNIFNSSATHVLNILGKNYNLSGGTITHGGAGSCTTFGQINFAADGTVMFNRTGDSHLISHVKQNIKAGCILSLQTGNIQIASYPTAVIDFLRMESGSRLELKSGQVFSNGLYSNSGLQVDSSAVLATQNPQGLYDETSNAAISAANNMNFFLHSSGIVEYNGSATQILTGLIAGDNNTQHKYGILRINFYGTNGTSVIMNSSNVFVRTSVQLVKGELNLNGETITIENGNANGISRIKGYIKSEVANAGNICWKNMVRGNHEFPFGVSATEYIPVIFSPVSGFGKDVTIETYPTSADNLPYPDIKSQTPVSFKDNTYAATDVIDRWWILQADGITADVTLTYRSSGKIIQGNIDIDTPLGIIQWNGSGWTTHGGTTTSNSNGAGTASIKNASVFSAWSIATRNIFSPIQLAAFNVEQVDNMINIRWTTATELNSDFFSVERSTDGIQFEEISKVKASGNSDSPLQYSSVDKNPLKGISYYRLKQINVDGKTSLSEVRIIKYNETTATIIEIENFGPNPFDNNFEVTYRTTKDGLVRFQLCSSKGDVLYSSELNNEKGSHRFDYNEGSTLQSGIYFLKLMYYDKTVTQKIIKK
jgi:hypothetical protein